MEVRITAHQDLDSRFPTGPNCLPSAFVVPANDKDGVVFPAADDVLDFGSIEPGKPAMPGRVRNVSQERMRVSREQWYVPLEFHAEAGARLFLGCRLVTEVHMDLNIGMRRQPPDPRGVVLDRMCADDSKPIRHPHAQFQRCFISMMTSQALRRRCKNSS